MDSLIRERFGGVASTHADKHTHTPSLLSLAHTHAHLDICNVVPMRPAKLQHGKPALFGVILQLVMMSAASNSLKDWAAMRAVSRGFYLCSLRRVVMECLPPIVVGRPLCLSEDLFWCVTESTDAARKMDYN